MDSQVTLENNEAWTFLHYKEDRKFLRKVPYTRSGFNCSLTASQLLHNCIVSWQWTFCTSTDSIHVAGKWPTVWTVTIREQWQDVSTV